MAKKKIPEFKTEEEEVEFWETHDATDYLDDSDRVKIDVSELREKVRKERASQAARYRKRAVS